MSTAGKRPQEQEYEFMGPWIGPVGIMLGLPGVCYALVYTCNAGGEHFLLPKPRWLHTVHHSIPNSNSIVQPCLYCHAS